MKIFLYMIVVFGISVSVEDVSAVAPASCTAQSVLYQCVAPTTACSSLGSTMVDNSACNDACNGGWKYCLSQTPSGNGSGSAGNGSGSSSGATGSGIIFPTDTGLPDPPGGVQQILANFFEWLLAIFGIIAIGAFIISGIQYLIASGDDDMIKTAKRNMTWSIVGVLVGLSGWIIMQAIDNALNANPFF